MEKRILVADKTTTHVSLEDYLEHYAADFYEWVDGELIPMPPVTRQHDLLSIYLRLLFDIYFDNMELGYAVNSPFVMQLGPNRFREPDLQVVLNENPALQTETAIHGPADICIEIVSKESTSRDYGIKLDEYEAAGVREYWLIDPLRKKADFYRHDGNSGLYSEIEFKEVYETPLLPRFKLHIPTLFQRPLPKRAEIFAAVEAMLAGR